MELWNGGWTDRGRFLDRGVIVRCGALTPTKNITDAARTQQTTPREQGELFEEHFGVV